MNKFEPLTKVLGDLETLFDQFILYEGKKLEALTSSDIDAFDGYMNDEQALLMKLRGLEQKREAILAQLGCAGLTFRQIIERCDGAQRDQLSAQYDSLSIKTKDLKDAVDCTRKHIELHQHRLDLILDRLTEGSSGVYDKSGSSAPPSPPGRFTPKKV